MLGPIEIDGTSLDPSEKARIVAENVSELMNFSLWGTPLGLVAGVVALVRDRHAPAAPPS